MYIGAHIDTFTYNHPTDVNHNIGCNLLPNHYNGEKKVSNSTVRLDPYSKDELQDMNDDRLEALSSLVRDAINRQYRAKDYSEEGQGELTRLQTEFCYITRELEIRRNRKKLHEEYMKTRVQARRGHRGHHRNNGAQRSYRQKR